MKSFKSYLMLVESFKDAKRIWIGKGADPTQVDEYIKKFRALNDKNRIDASNKDIGVWMSRQFNSFVNFINDMDAKSEQKTNYRGLDDEVFKILDNEFCYVIVPKTYRASNKLGSSNWCIVYGNSYYDDYIGNNGLTPYYITFKDSAKVIDWIYEFEGTKGDISQVAVMIDESGDVHSIWDGQDNKIDEDYTFEYYEGGDKFNDKEDAGDETLMISLDEVFALYGVDTNKFRSLVRETEPNPPEISEYDLSEYFDGRDSTTVGNQNWGSQFGEQFRELDQYYKENDIEQPVEYEYLEEFLKKCALFREPGNIKDLDLNEIQDHYHRTFEYPEIEIIKGIYNDFEDFTNEIENYGDDDRRWTLDY